MHTGYLVIAKDGKEYGPLDRDTIQLWYHEGRLDQNSKVYEPGKHKFRLKEVFDLTVWNNPALINEAAAKAAAQPDFTPKTNIIAVPNERTPGMLVAAFLLLAIGLVEVLAIAAILAQRIYAPKGEMFQYVLGAAADLVLAIGLFRGNQKFRGWGLARAVIGGFLIVLGLATTSAASGWQLASSGFELLMCAGIAALLAGETPSKFRIWAGAAAVLAAWSGLITVDFVAGLAGHSGGRDSDGYSVFDLAEGGESETSRASSELGDYILGVGAFEDDLIGVSIRFPRGWVMLAPDNPIVKRPDAVMVVAHVQTGCMATLEAAPADEAGSSTDVLVARIIMRQSRSQPSAQMLGNRDIGFGGNRGVRIETSWTKDGKRFRGFTTACKAGASYYFLTGWCVDEAYEEAFEEFQSLEQAFQIRGSTATPSLGGAPKKGSSSKR